ICHMFLLAEFLGIPTKKRSIKMIELQLHELKLVSGGGPVTDNIAGNVANAATTKGGPTWGDFVAIPAAAATVHFLPKNFFGAIWCKWCIQSDS
ncbi:hypothetical protein ACCD32_04820, partial [Neisseria gonorrhoeae]